MVWTFAWAPVSVLLGLCGPSTVAGFVVPVIVDAVECPAERPWSHVREEVLERVHPSLTDGDSAASVVLPVPGVRISAALAHGGPTVKFRGGSTASAVPMRGSGPESFGGLIVTQAPTASRVAVAQLLSRRLLPTAAITLTCPGRMRVSTAARAFQDGQPAESLTDQVASGRAEASAPGDRSTAEVATRYDMLDSTVATAKPSSVASFVFCSADDDHFPESLTGQIDKWWHPVLSCTPPAYLTVTQ